MLQSLSYLRESAPQPVVPGAIKDLQGFLSSLQWHLYNFGAEHTGRLPGSSFVAGNWRFIQAERGPQTTTLNSKDATFRAVLKGTNLRGQTPIRGFLRKSAVFCENLRFPIA